MMKLGVDLGGTKIESIVLNAHGKAIWCKRVPTPQGNYKKTLGAIAELVGQAKMDNGLAVSEPIGIGTPGALFIPEGQSVAVMKNSNSTALNGQPLRQDLKAILGCEVYLENDANCFALAETLSGCGAQFESELESTFGVILGTGVGGGVVVHKRLLHGRHQIAGEWGHNSLPASVLSLLPENERQRQCYCERTDCIETYLSGPGLAHSYALRFNAHKDPKEIIQAVRQKERKALSVWNSYLEQLAASLAHVVNILDPELIILGGGMSLVDEIYDQLPAKMASYVFTKDFTTPILPAKLGDSAGVYGAAWLTV